MAQSDPLYFLDELEPTGTDGETQVADSLSFLGSGADPLSFLDSLNSPTNQYVIADYPQEDLVQTVSDLPEAKPNMFDYFRPEELTPEQLKALPWDKKREYADQLNLYRELQQSSGFNKGLMSGMTFGASEHIPDLKPGEEDLLVGLGDATGSYLPISGMYQLIGKPLVNFAAKSKIARDGLMALARMTGFGLTGSAHKATKDIVKGEVPSVTELAKEGVLWAGIDGALQALGLGVAFTQSVNRIAAEEGVTAKEVLNRLWESSKNYIKLKFGRSVKGEVLPEDAEVLFNEAMQAEKALRPKGITEKAPIEPATEPVTSKAENVVEPSNTFTTAKGSTYTVNPDGTTTRNKAARPEHPGEEGIQPQSERTYYVTPEEANALSEIQTQGGPDKRIIELPDGRLGIMYETGKDAGKVESRTLVQPKNAPQEGLIPVESWEGGKKIHFGNPITQMGGKQPKTEPAQKEPTEYAITKPEDISIGMRGGKGTATLRVKKVSDDGKDYFVHEELPITKEEKQLVDTSNAFSDAGDMKESSALAQQAREMIFNRLKGKEPKVEELSKKTTQVPPPKARPRKPSIVGKKQAAARSKVIQLFRDAFNDPIRLGKIGKKKTLGIHKLWPRVTRLLKDNDVETAAHEIGHNLHTLLYGGNAKNPQEQLRNIETALQPYLNELKPLAHYAPYGPEGFAEFVRLYVTNPEVARELAPNFYEKFFSDMSAQYPELNNALLEAREYYDNYLQGTPQSRIRAQTSYAEDKGKLSNMVDAVKKGLNLDYLKTQFLDDLFPAKRLVAEAFGIPLSEVENLKDEKNLYRSLRVLKGAVGKADVFVLHEAFNAKTLDKVDGSLRDILKQLPDEEAYREFNDYLIARRAVEKHGQGIETGLEPGDALAVEADLKDKYGKLAKELDKYNDSLLRYAVDSGLISPKHYAAIKKNNLMYVPFQRVMEKDKGRAASSAGKLQAGQPIKNMKGSTRDILPPIESVLKNTYSIIINAEKNLAGQVLAKIATMKNIGSYVETVPTPIKLKGKVYGDEVARKLAREFEEQGISELIEYDSNGKPVLREDISDAIPEVFLRFGAGKYPAGENIITVYVDGKPKYYEVSPEIYEMWSKGTAPYTANLLTKILRVPARTLRAGAILNPRFIQKNFIRDTWGSWLFTKYGKSAKDPVGLFMDTIYSPLAMMATAAKQGKLYVEWMKAGGGMGTMQSLDRDSVVKKLEEVRDGYKPHQVIKWLRSLAEISEEANRLSEFGKALEVEGNTRIGKEIAAFAARDLSIDFAKIGLQTKALNQIIPFFNATIQGGDKLLRTMFNPEDRKNFLPRVIGFIVLPSLMLAWLNKDDPDVQEFYEEEKDFNFITKVGDSYIKIPVPFETGVIAHGLTQRMFNYFMNKNPEAFEGFMGSVMSAMLPNVIPTLANPLIETWANKNFFTGGRIVPMGKEGLVSRYQYKNTTSATARLLGRAMTYMLGEDTRSKAAAPAIIDHFVNSWTGGLGRLMINISDASLEAAGLSDKIPGPHQTITERLGLDAFTARYPRSSTRSIEKFYDNYADATARKRSVSHAQKMGTEPEEQVAQAYQRLEHLYDYKSLQRAYKAIQSCQKEINNIWNDPSIDPDLKKTMIDDLYLQMIEFARAANDQVEQYKLNQ